MGLASSASSARLSLTHLAILALGSMLAIAGVLLASRLANNFGFPLDDSWIHATYARSLALTGAWEFRPGIGSGGSTSPLWTLLLTPGYWFRLAPLWWSHILSFLLLTMLAAEVEFHVRTVEPGYRPLVPWAGLLVGTEWHLVWAAASGMETVLHAALLTIVLLMLLRGGQMYAAMGLLSGLCVWVRPDGLVLLPLVVLAIELSAASGTAKMRALLAYGLGLGALLVPYVVFNLSVAGTPFPSTFYAKQAEYSAWQARSILERLTAGILQLSTGPAITLWPAVAIQAVHAARTRNFTTLAVLAWSVSYIAMYCMRLPAYQHGRYLIPALPILLLLGVLGVLRFGASGWLGRKHWMFNFAWRAALVMAQVGFLLRGAAAYAQDVALIETEMVVTAKWIRENLPSESILAAHDIGALGYVDDHELIDLAGLISPEVIPFIRDQERLAGYLDERGATHLVTFPGLYPELVGQSRLLFTSGGWLAPTMGEGNLSVYCWRCP